jgi:preprotein translocase subunit YajC
VIPELHSFLILAQQGQPAQQADPYWSIRMMGTILFAMVLFYFMFIRPQKRKDQDLRDMVHNLKQNDRVVTIGGIHGVVTNVQRDAERLTIRVDESNGTKLRVNMSAIARVLREDEPETSGATANKS